MAKRFHLALGVIDLAATIADYQVRLGQAPDLVIPHTYALWRTDHLNLSLRQLPAPDPGQPAPAPLRHLGWEVDSTDSFTTTIDCNGIPWETFTAAQQRAEILALWPEATLADPGTP